jgi:large subunit ribosomal protein L25
MNVVPLTVETGRPTGSASSRRMRAEGQLPATVYGLGHPTVSVTVDRRELRKALTTAAGVNALLQLSYDGEQHYALVKEVQRHPVRRDPVHLDFQRIDPEQPIALDVPVHLTGEAKAVTAAGGIVEQILTTLRVSVRPDSIPNEFVADISHLEIDTTITVGELSLPEGVTPEVDLDAAIVSATLTRAAVVAANEEAAEGEEGVEGEAEADEAGDAGADAGDAGD